MRRVGALFQIDPEPLIKVMKADFDLAQNLVSTALLQKPLTAVWVDCVWDCGKRDEIYVGAGSGTPNMLMEEAGLTNVFKDKAGLWVYVTAEEIIAKNPDVFILIDWKRDPALETKIAWLHNGTLGNKFCDLDAVKAARYITVPFSASGAGPRNGAAALDLATAALQVKKGLQISTQKSGVSSFKPSVLQEYTKNFPCPMKNQGLVYTTDAGSIHCNTKQTACLPPAEQLEVLKAVVTSVARATGVSFCFLVLVASILQ
jgi:hypothetical protein